MSFKQKREQANLTQAAVANELGITQAAVAHWEAGRFAPTAKQLPKIAKLYKCTIDELLKEDD